jgi:hypothetical protein
MLSLSSQFFVNPKTKGSASGNSDTDTQSEVSASRNAVSVGLGQEKSRNINERLVDWMTDLLLDHAKKVVHSRRNTDLPENDTAHVYHPEEGKTCMDEVKTVINMPAFDSKLANTNSDHRNAKISEKAVTQLREYVAQIASKYHSNPFHNFEHACHVTMSVNKLLKRIVAPDIAVGGAKTGGIASQLHDYTHGINSDPLTILGIVFSALIHDVDHQGKFFERQCSLIIYSV